MIKRVLAHFIPAAWTFLLYNALLVEIVQDKRTVVLRFTPVWRLNVTFTLIPQKFRWYIGIYATFITKHTVFSSTLDHFVHCLILSCGNASEDRIIAAHILNKKHWRITIALPELYFSLHARPLLTYIQPHTVLPSQIASKSQKSQDKGWRQQNRIKIHLPNAGSQWSGKKKKKLKQLTFCPGRDVWAT